MAEETPTCASLGCSSLSLEWWQPCSFGADPDIAGIGIILSFVISMNLTFFLALYGFYFVKNSFAENTLNQLDNTIIETATKILKLFSKHERRPITQDVFRETIRQFSDTQLVTGLAILVVGFGKINTITAYHFSVVGDLANMAFVVHLSTLDIVANDFTGRPQKWWRVFGIVAIALLTAASTVPWLNSRFLNEKYGAPAKCVWSTIPENTAAYEVANTTIYLILQVWGIADILSSFFPQLFQKQPFRFVDDVTRRVLEFPSRVYRFTEQRHAALQTTSTPGSKSKTVFWTIAKRLAWLATFVTFVTTEIVFSQAFTLMRNWAFLLLNVKEVFEFRAESNKDYQYKDGDENAWGFGQLVPLLLMILPIATLFEVYFDGYFRRQQEERRRQEELKEKVDELSTDSNAGESSSLQNTPDGDHHQNPVPPRSNTMELGHISHPDEGATSSPSSDLATATNQRKTHSLDFAQLYDKETFKLIMQLIMFGIFVAITIAAVLGWAF